MLIRKQKIISNYLIFNICIAEAFFHIRDLKDVTFFSITNFTKRDHKDVIFFSNITYVTKKFEINFNCLVYKLFSLL